MSTNTSPLAPNVLRASLRQRFIAHYLDRFILLIMAGLIVLWSGYYYSEIDPGTGSEVAFLFLISQILCFQGVLALFVGASIKGTTPGKWLLRLYVVKWDGRQASAATILLRETLAKGISALVWGFLWAVFSDDDLAAHDRIMQTQVIYVKRVKGGEEKDD